MFSSKVLDGLQKAPPGDDRESGPLLSREDNCPVSNCKKRPRAESEDFAMDVKGIDSCAIQRSVTYDEGYDHVNNNIRDDSIMEDSTVSSTQTSNASGDGSEYVDDDHYTGEDRKKIPAGQVKVQNYSLATSEEKLVKRWSCDICNNGSFETLEAARSHEVQCKLQHGGIQPVTDKHDLHHVAGSDGSLTNFATLGEESEAQGNDGGEDLAVLEQVNPPINIIPQGNDSTLLSDYNNLLVRHIEFFFPAQNEMNYNIQNESKGGDDENRLGLRCIHCADHPYPITAATFFPSSIGSIASGLGTIGSRHFGWGKCPYVQPEVVKQMIETKKTSGLQTRTNGRIGLDAYCKNIARQCQISDDDGTGIYLREGIALNQNQIDRGTKNEFNAGEICNMSVTHNTNQPPSKCYPVDDDRDVIASVLAGMKHDTNIGSSKPFLPGDVQFFWECRGCRSVPFNFRSKGSVVFSVGAPPPEMIESHLKHCKGNKALAIPQTAVIEPFYGESIPPIRVKWGNIQGESLTGERSINRRVSNQTIVKSGVENEPLAFPEDKMFTTDFAFFTVMQLKKCYLTKSGGSRGSCPVGYPGLACSHCAGKPNERRFFYTSADHLRNSFAHIPAHIVECSACPSEIQQRIEALKEIRNRQKSQLKAGYHKIFIDRVWERLHGPPASDDESVTAGITTMEPSVSYTQSAVPALSTQSAVPTLSTQSAIPTLSTRSAVPTSAMGNVTNIGSDEDKTPPTSARLTRNVLVKESDRCCTTDHNFFTLLQVKPYDIAMHNNSSRENGSHDIGFPGLMCIHCMGQESGRKFFTTSADHLGDLLTTISNHMLVCKECPDLVKSQIVNFKTAHNEQLLRLKEGENGMFMKRVWTRLVNPNTKSDSPFDVAKEAVQYETVDPNTPLVRAKDSLLVTPFTLYTMQQVRPCNLENSGNGSRSAFDYGFPGLECIHCAGYPNPRRFFYRTADILGGNYAHIPNHLMKCSKCPPEVKASLAQKKEMHLIQKSKLDRGSQRVFFNRVWERLHSNTRKDEFGE